MQNQISSSFCAKYKVSIEKSEIFIDENTHWSQDGEEDDATIAGTREKG